jgi:hypothetical protein
MTSLRGTGREPVVVVAGHVTHDRRPGAVRAGGAALHAARCYRVLGATTRLVSAVGADFACIGELAGVHAELRRGAATTELAGDRLVARAEPVLAVDLPEAWRRCDVLHLAPTLAEVDLARWIQVTHAARIVIDVGGFLRVPAPGGRAVAIRTWAVDARALARVELAYATAAELATQGDLLHRLVAAVPVVAVLRGALADLYIEGCATRIRIHPHPAAEIGATLALALARGESPVAAAELAPRIALAR